MKQRTLADRLHAARQKGRYFSQTTFTPARFIAEAETMCYELREWGDLHRASRAKVGALNNTFHVPHGAPNKAHYRRATRLNKAFANHEKVSRRLHLRVARDKLAFRRFLGLPPAA